MHFIDRDLDRGRAFIFNDLVNGIGVFAVFRKGCGEIDCPVLDKWWDGSFSFPWWCGMDDAVIDTLCSSLISAVEELRG